MKLPSNNKQARTKFILVFKGIFLLLAPVLLVSFKAELTSDEKENATEMAANYATLLTQYSSCGNHNDGDKIYVELSNIFIDLNNFQSVKHTNDLFLNENVVSFDEYLNSIEKNYSYGLKMDFGKPEIIECSETIEGKKVAYIGMKKNVSYKDETKSVYVVVAVDIAANKIIQVFFPEDCRNTSACSESIANGETSEGAYQQYFAAGEANFQKHEYVTAKVNFEKAALYKTDDDVRRKIRECDNLMTIVALKEEGEANYNRGNYYAARELFQRLSDNYSNEADYAKDKIASCNTAINDDKFNRYKRAGDEYYREKMWAKAVDAYDYCLQMKPGDPFCLSQIEASKKKNNSYVDDVIDAAYRAKRRGNYGYAFKLLYSVEPSGRLDGSDYYLMASILENERENVLQFMPFTEAYCYNLSIVYCRRSLKFGNRKIAKIWKPIYNQVIQRPYFPQVGRFPIISSQRQYRRSKSEYNPAFHNQSKPQQSSAPRRQYNQPQPQYNQPRQQYSQPRPQTQPRQQYNQAQPQYRQSRQQYSQAQQQYRQSRQQYNQPRPQTQSRQQYNQAQPQYRQSRQQYNQPRPQTQPRQQYNQPRLQRRN